MLPESARKVPTFFAATVTDLTPAPAAMTTGRFRFPSVLQGRTFYMVVHDTSLLACQK
jgi:hypothetical protein